MSLVQDARGLVIMKMVLLVLLFMPDIFWLNERQWGSKIKTKLHIKSHCCFSSLDLFLDLEISFLSNLFWHWKWFQKGLANTGCFSPKGKCNYKILNCSQLSTPHRFKSLQEPAVFTKMQWPSCKLVIQNTNLKKKSLKANVSQSLCKWAGRPGLSFHFRVVTQSLITYFLPGILTTKQQFCADGILRKYQWKEVTKRLHPKNKA